MRDYSNLDKYLDRLQKDIYHQPGDKGHTAWATQAIDRFLPPRCKTVLDVGCGAGFAKPIFQSRGVKWTGISMSKEDIVYAKEALRQVTIMDMSFLEYPDNSFDLIFARHILEHSPMPLLTLMEWKRVCTLHAIVIVPAVDFWGRGGKNHYYVLDEMDWWNLFEFAGWKIIDSYNMGTRDREFIDNRPTKDMPAPKIVEHQFLLEK